MPPEVPRRQLVYMPMECEKTAEEVLQQERPATYIAGSPKDVIRIPLDQMREKFNMLGVLTTADSFGADRIHIILPNEGTVATDVRALVTATRERYGQSIPTIHILEIPMAHFAPLRGATATDVHVHDSSHRAPDEAAKRGKHVTMRLPGGAALLATQTNNESSELPKFGDMIEQINARTRVRIWQTCFANSMEHLKGQYDAKITELEAVGATVDVSPSDYMKYIADNRIDRNLPHRFGSAELASSTLKELKEKRKEIFRDTVQYMYRILYPYHKTHRFNLGTAKGIEELKTELRVITMVERLRTFHELRARIVGGAVPPFEISEDQIDALRYSVKMGASTNVSRARQLESIRGFLETAKFLPVQIQLLIREGHFDDRPSGGLSEFARTNTDFTNEFTTVARGSPTQGLPGSPFTAVLLEPNFVANLTNADIERVAPLLGINLAEFFGGIDLNRKKIEERIKEEITTAMQREDVGKAATTTEIIADLERFNDAIALRAPSPAASPLVQVVTFNMGQLNVLAEALEISRIPRSLNVKLPLIRSLLSSSFSAAQAEYLLCGGYFGPSIATRARSDLTNYHRHIPVFERAFIPGGLGNFKTEEISAVALRLGLDVTGLDEDAKRRRVENDINGRMGGVMGRK